MTRYLKFAGIALLALVTFAPLASARPPAFGGGFRGGFRGGFYGPRVGYVYRPAFGWYNPGWYGWGGYGGYGLGWYQPYGYASNPNAGKVKVETKAKDSQVYVDGAYAGTVKQLGSFPLKTGEHDIELRMPSGQTYYQNKVEVIAGRTTEIKPVMPAGRAIQQ
jgi:hypothetical protein